MKQIFKKRFLPYFLIVLFLCVSLSSCGTPANLFSFSEMQNTQRAFDSYTNELFVQEMQQNTINLHYTISNPQKYGITSHKISLGGISRASAEESRASLENISAALAGFDYDSLTGRQKLTYDVCRDYCEKELSGASFYYYKEPLRPTTGTQSELPVLLAEYEFRNPCDVTDYLALLTCIEEYFNQIIQFEQEKAEEGLFMPDYAADTIISACRTFAKNPKENYLISTFQSRIDSMDNLSEEKKELYKKQNESLVENIVIPSYQKLADALENLKGFCTDGGGLCQYPQGKAYYEYLVRSNTGSDKSIEELQEMTKRQRSLDLAALHDLLASNPKLLQAEEPPLAASEPEAILNHLLEAMLDDFYPAADSTFEINSIPKALEDTLAPAFYLTAPIDDISRNVIYLNEKKGYTGLQLFTTLAHEGFPGHLYQTTGSSQAEISNVRALFNYPGYVEGWATYVEMLSYRYAGLPEDYAQMQMRNQSAMLSLYASIDMGIHYNGWNLADTMAFLKDYNITNMDVVQSIYELIVEEPSHYLKYYIGYLEFLELKEYAKEKLGTEYSERNFHQAVIRIGPAPFPVLKKYLQNFYG